MKPVERLYWLCLFHLSLFAIACSGTEATDDRKIFESHVESGKIFRLDWMAPVKPPASDGDAWMKNQGSESFTILQFDSCQITLGNKWIECFPPSFQAPRKHKEAENGTVHAESMSKSKECNGAPLLSECALQEVRDDLQLHLCMSALMALPVVLITPSLLHWIRNLRYSIEMEGACERAC